MNFKFYIGTKVFFGEGCISTNKNEVAKLGKKAMIVTGATSAKKSGALDDFTAVLDEKGIEYMIYDKIENNPALKRIQDGGMAAREFNPDFIAGIGGGSPLDAAKAIAVLAANDIDPLDLFSNKFENKPLPVVAIPTTAGTGSEVTPYAVLTREDIQTKKSFGNEDTFPKIAFIDPVYTESMSRNITIYTALDALSHAVEGYISKRSTPVSDILAEKAIECFGECAANLLNGEIDRKVREKLMYAAMLGGLVISHTGTTIVHSMGYPLTYFKNVQHGKANGLFMAEYLKFNYECARQKIDTVIKLLGLKNMDEFEMLINSLIPNDIRLSSEEVERYASGVMEQRNASYNIRKVSREDIANIMNRLFVEKQ